MVVVNIVDTLTYFYIKRIKRGMQCPVCNQKLIFSKSKASWCCNNCDYSLQENDFYDDYVFMFCDECNAYLNNQEGFDKNATKNKILILSPINDYYKKLNKSQQPPCLHKEVVYSFTVAIYERNCINLTLSNK